MDILRATYKFKTYQFVRALIKKLLDKVMVMELKGKSHGLWVLAKLAVQLECCLQQVGIFWVRHIRDTAGEIQAHPLVRILGITENILKHY